MEVATSADGKTEPAQRQAVVASDAYTPTEIQDISEKACLAAAKLWKKECDAAKCRGAEPPDPPLNLEERAFCRKVLPALLAMRDGRRSGRGRQEYSEVVRQQHSMHHLLHTALLEREKA